ncbi:MAG TPA: hypothetical protein P5099_03930 [Candidatus Moranbacteria bacterium]|nr:hypothetical protein [Candidatus Moranbacteria bacterium]HSA08492.1 hypothetical protein [Candidatus Moranbacteria bacterium]
MKKEAIKKELTVFLACILFLLSGFKTCKAVEIPDEEKWTDYDNYIVIDADTTWNGQVVYDDPYKPVAIVNGATLTIEKGTTVQIMSLEVYTGRIVAEGTQSEKIKFTKSIPELPEGYKPECLYAENGIKFYEKGWLDEYAVEPSVFRYVEFENMGSDYLINEEECACPYTEGGCQAMNNNIFYNLFKTAMAASYTKVESPVLNFESGNLLIENSSFKNNFYADIKVNVMYEYEDYGYRLSLLEVANSNFEGNSADAALISNVEVNKKEYGLVHSKNVVKLRNNWYGNPLGPKVAPDYLLGGEKIIGDYTLDGWSTTRFNDVCTDCASNVMFLPGIKASKLYKNGMLGTEDQLWPPNYGGNDVEDLILNENGESVNEVYTKEVIEEVGVPVVGGNIYKTFVNDLDDWKNSGVINDYNIFAYDWRQNVEDIAENGTPYSNEIKSAITILNSLSESSKSKKVTIIAHSNGGLLAKAIMLELDNQGLSDKVDKIVFVGTPQMGTPISILSMLYGYDESALFGTLISQSEARTFAENMPGAYSLLPSKEYFNRAENSLISFLSLQTRYKNFIDAYGEKINSFDEFKDFLLGKIDGREKPEGNEVEKENVLNEDLFNQAIETHERLDNWTPPVNVEVIQIAGWGLDTISGVDYTEKEEVECGSESDNGIEIRYCEKKGKFSPIYEPKFTVDGDAVVVTPSALMFSDAANIKKYWVDLWSYDDLFHTRKEHKDIFEVESLQQFLSNIITNKYKELPLPENIKDNRPNPDGYDNAKSRLRMALYSPLNIHLYDNAGNHTGPKTITIDGGTKTIFEEGIPNSYYYQFGDQKYVGVPSGEHIQMKMDGYDSGAYTLKIEEVKVTESGDEIISHTTFANLPVSSETTVTLDIPQTGLENLSNLQADYDGDGANDYVVTPVPNGEATLSDMIAPEIKIISPENKKYLNNENISLNYNVSDGQSGVKEQSIFWDAKTYVKNGIDLSLVSLGEHIFKIIAKDYAGNSAENQIKLNVTTNPRAMIENVEHYFKLGLIKNKGEKNFLIAKLSIIEQNAYLLNMIKISPFFNQKTKNVLEQVIKKITNNQIDLLIFQINHHPNVYDKSVKGILIECLNFVRI